MLDIDQMAVITRIYYESFYGSCYMKTQRRRRRFNAAPRHQRLPCPPETPVMLVNTRQLTESVLTKLRLSTSYSSPDPIFLLNNSCGQFTANTKENEQRPLPSERID